MRADNFAILQILIENKCCLMNVYDFDGVKNRKKNLRGSIIVILYI